MNTNQPSDVIKLITGSVEVCEGCGQNRLALVAIGADLIRQVRIIREVASHFPEGSQQGSTLRAHCEELLGIVKVAHSLIPKGSV